MSKPSRRSSERKLQVVLSVLRGEVSVAESARRHRRRNRRTARRRSARPTPPRPRPRREIQPTNPHAHRPRRRTRADHQGHTPGASDPDTTYSVAHRMISPCGDGCVASEGSVASLRYVR